MSRKEVRSRLHSEIDSEIDIESAEKIGLEDSNCIIKTGKRKKKKMEKFRPDKLLVLDLNKVLIYRPPFTSSDFELRPYAMDFVKRMSKLFVLAIWSSAKKDTIKRLTKKLFRAEDGFCRSRFAFIWNQDHCEIVEDEGDCSSSDQAAVDRKDTDRAIHYYGDAKKPVMRKNLSKIVESFPEYARKVILIDDEPKKTEKNPSASVINIKPFCPKVRQDALNIDQELDDELKESSALSHRLALLARQDGDLY